jgi:hypothetical protein
VSSDSRSLPTNELKSILLVAISLLLQCLADIGEDGRWPFQFKEGRSESPPRAGTLTRAAPVKSSVENPTNCPPGHGKDYGNDAGSSGNGCRGQVLATGNQLSRLENPGCQREERYGLAFGKAGLC